MPIGPLPALPKYRTDLVSRRMCRTAQLDPRFAREVLAEYAEDGIRAAGLPVGVNVVAVVRHARQAEARVLRRDRVLAGLLALLPALLLLAARSLTTGHGALAAAAAAGLPAVVLAALVVVYRELWTSWRIARELGEGAGAAAGQAPPVEPELERQLELLKRANLVVYHEDVAGVNPFVGSGWRIYEQVWAPINIARPARDSAGNPLTPVPFNAADIHDQVARWIIKDSGLDGISVRNRLYARGTFLANLPWALPDPTGRPLTVVDSQWVKAGAANPTTGLETYLCLRMIGDGGRVVVSMHLRAQLTRTSLTWNVNAYVLPPLGPRFDLPDRQLAGPVRLRARALADAARATPGLLFGSVGALLGRAADAAGKARRLERTRREIRKNYGTIDYGTTNSLRERASFWPYMEFAERRDSSTYFKLMVQAVLDATEQFLAAHRIDTADLTAQQQQQIFQTQTTIFNGAIQNAVIGGVGNVQNNYVAPPGGGSSAGGPNPAAAPSP
ncbi:hypothetical protein ACFV1L_20160 [Kitasatospora sp. NPDC059646]|uniref:hypothetical protein n=1 Tax=Kitasatospora sp. NPDC059646 TaxID=3346893 RepID=UPI003689387C